MAKNNLERWMLVKYKRSSSTELEITIISQIYLIGSILYLLWDRVVNPSGFPTVFFAIKQNSYAGMSS